MSTKRNAVEVVVHIDEALQTEQITRLENSLGSDRGIMDARVNRERNHLMMVDYLPGEITARQVLGYVQNHGYHAELIGGL